MVVRHRAVACVRGAGADTAADALYAVFMSRPGAGGVVRLRLPEPGDRPALADALYEALELPEPRPRRQADAERAIADSLRSRPRTVVLERAHELRTIALQVLYGLWAHQVPDHFPLLLAGDDRLDTVLRRPALAGLHSYMLLWHSLPPAD